MQVFLLECEGSGTTQKAKLGEKGMSARLRLLDKGKNLWITACNKKMQKLTSEAEIPENATTDGHRRSPTPVAEHNSMTRDRNLS